MTLSTDTAVACVIMFIMMDELSRRSEHNMQRSDEAKRYGFAFAYAVIGVVASCMMIALCIPIGLWLLHYAVALFRSL